jgi:hypothetical protein
LGWSAIVEIAGLRGDDLRRLAAGVEQELVGLVAADVGQDAAIARLVPEPVRPAGADPVRGEVDVWITLPIAPVWTSSPGLDRRGHLEALGIHDRELAAGFLDRAAHIGELASRAS